LRTDEFTRPASRKPWIKCAKKLMKLSARPEKTHFIISEFPALIRNWSRFSVA